MPMPPSRPRFLRRLRVDVLLLLLVALGAVMGLRLYGAADGSSSGVEWLATPYAEAEATEPQQDASDTLRVDAMPKSGPPVRFLMFNVKNYFVVGEQQRSRYASTPKPEEEREAVAEVIASVRPAVVGLVEIGGPLALEDLRRRLQQRGLEYPHHFVLTRGGEDRALALLSMYPMVQNRSQRDYGLYGQQRRKLLRGILDVVVRAEDGRLFRVLGAHLKSRVSDDAAAAASLRRREAHTLALYIRDVMAQQPNLPIVVYGDWNDNPADTAARILEQGVSRHSTLKRIKATDSRGEEWTHYYRRGNAYNTFDQIFVNTPLRRRMKSADAEGVVDIPAAGRASDHRAVWCELR